MASTTLVRELLFRVSDQLVDTDPQFTRWTQRTLVNAVNDGQRVIAKFLPSSCSRVDAIKLVPGTRQSIEVVPAIRIKPGDGSTAVERHGIRLISAPIRNLGADGLTPGAATRVVDRYTLDSSDPNWHIATGKAVRQVVYDPLTPQVFWVSPGVPAATDVWLELPWLPEPLEVPAGGDYAKDGSDTTKLSIDDRMVDDLMNYVLARAQMRDAEFAVAAGAAGAHAQLFAASINAQAVAAGLPNPKLTGLPTQGA